MAQQKLQGKLQGSATQLRIQDKFLLSMLNEKNPLIPFPYNLETMWSPSIFRTRTPTRVTCAA